MVYVLLDLASAGMMQRAQAHAECAFYFDLSQKLKDEVIQERVATDYFAAKYYEQSTCTILTNTNQY